MAKTIRYGSYCIPQEQVSGTSPFDKFHLDGDCGRKLGGNNTYTVNSYTGPAIATSDTTLSAGQDFVAIKALSIDSGTVLISLNADEADANDIVYLIKLLKGECFASKIRSDAQPVVTISGTASVDYMTGT